MQAAVRFTDPDENVVEGVLCPYHVPDSYGTQFRPTTDFCLALFGDGARPVLWHHGLGESGSDVIGRITGLQSTSAGLTMRAILDKTSQWFTRVRDSIRKGAVGLSSGSLGHLVRIDDRTGDILKWPLIEGSLTPTPACSAAVITRYAIKSDAARAHFAAAGLPFDDPTPEGRRLTADRPWHSFPYEGSPLQLAVRREVEAGRRLLLREDARSELEEGRRCLLLAAAREELRACRCLLDELDPGPR